MTTHITKADTFLGFPATKLRTMLTSWEKGRCEPHELSGLKSLNFTTGACAAFLGECFDRKFIVVGYPDGLDEPEDRRGPPILKLSDAGTAIAAASARKRAPKDKAAAALERLVANAERISRDKNALLLVDQIWVFGSFIDDTKQDVGDLDVVVTTRSNEKLKGLDLKARLAHLRKHYPGVVPEHVMFYYREEEWVKRMIYGTRRDPLVAPNSMHNLVGMHRPCRQVYDHGRGGRIAPEDHPHHPDSSERADYMKDRLVMPDLGGFPENFQFIPASVYMWPAEIVSGVPAVIGERALSPPDLARYGSRPLDGRDGMAAVLEGETGKALFHIGRTVEFTDDIWTYRLTIDAVHVPRGFAMSRWRLHEFTEMIGGLFNGDILRLADRRAKLGVYPEIVADLDFCEKSARFHELVDRMQIVTAEPWSSKRGETLPAEYRYAINLWWSGEMQFGYSGPADYDDCDWDESPVPRDAYEEWLSALGASSATPGSPFQP